MLEQCHDQGTLKTMPRMIDGHRISIIVEMDVRIGQRQFDSFSFLLPRPRVLLDTR